MMTSSEATCQSQYLPQTDRLGLLHRGITIALITFLMFYLSVSVTLAEPKLGLLIAVACLCLGGRRLFKAHVWPLVAIICYTTLLAVVFPGPKPDLGLLIAHPLYDLDCVLMAALVLGGQPPSRQYFLLLGILAVFSWAYARPHLAATSTAAAAGCFLLLNALGAMATIPFLTAAPAQLDWQQAALPLVLAALLNLATWWLWFWLLERMTLAAFGMRALATWAAAIVPGFVLVSLTNWRNDAAFVIAIAALVAALRARTADEQPLALGLASP